MARKKHYLSEFSVNLFTSNWLLIPADQVTSGGEMRPEEKVIADNSHIYLICRRPALRMDAGTFEYQDGIASGDLIYSINGAEHRVPSTFGSRSLMMQGALRFHLIRTER